MRLLYMLSLSLLVLFYHEKGNKGIEKTNILYLTPWNQTIRSYLMDIVSDFNISRFTERAVFSESLIDLCESCFKVLTFCIFSIDAFCNFGQFILSILSLLLSSCAVKDVLEKE